jgi:hypothetical protein
MGRNTKGSLLSVGATGACIAALFAILSSFVRTKQPAGILTKEA